MGSPGPRDGRVTVETKDILLARLGEIHVARKAPMVGCHGLGSCIGLMAYDVLSQVGGVAHVVLPDSTGRKDLELPGRYMDIAVPALISQLIATGASKPRLKFVAVGGANVFKFGSGAASLNLSIGERNIQALYDCLKEMNLRLEADLLGGTQATSTQLCLGSGQVFVACGSREMNLLHKFVEGQYVRAA